MPITPLPLHAELQEKLGNVLGRDRDAPLRLRTSRTGRVQSSSPPVPHRKRVTHRRGLGPTCPLFRGGPWRRFGSAESPLRRGRPLREIKEGPKDKVSNTKQKMLRPLVAHGESRLKCRELQYHLSQRFSSSAQPTDPTPVHVPPTPVDPATPTEGHAVGPLRDPGSPTPQTLLRLQEVRLLSLLLGVGVSTTVGTTYPSTGALLQWRATILP